MSEDTTQLTAETQSSGPPPPGWLRKHGAKLVALLFWVAVVGGYYLYARRNGISIDDAVTSIADFITNSVYGPLVYIILYTLRPLIFFPASILSLLGGFLFGPIGIIYTIIGGNASAMVGYGIGRYFGEGMLENQDDTGVIQRYAQRMRDNSFETVLLMRLVFLPYDLVNYAAGFLRIDWKAFLAATAIGSLPATISIVLLGASFGTLDELLAGNIQLNPVTLVASVVLIVISLILSRLVKRREAAKSAPDAQQPVKE